MTVRAPFQPHRGTNQVVTPAAVSASVNINAVDKTVRVYNSGANICYVRIGVAPQIASTAEFAVGPAQSYYLQKGDGDNVIAFISAAGTTLNIQTGEGAF